MKNKRIRGIALLLSMALLISEIQLTTIVARAEGDNAAITQESGNTIKPSIETAMEEDSLSLGWQEVGEECFDLGEVETSAIPGSFLSLSDGNVSLKSGTATNWIDRLDLTDAQEIRNIYDTLIEASDNDGQEDYLIEDTYFNGDNAIAVTKVAGTTEGTYSAEDTNEQIKAKVQAEVGEIASEIFTKYVPYMRAAYDAFDRDYPEVFWLDGKTQVGYSYGYSLTGSDGIYTASYEINIKFILQNNSFDIRANNYRSESAIKSAITTVNNKTSELVNAVSGKTTEEKITYFNDYLTKSNEYNTSADLNNIAHDCRECTTALVGKTGTEGPVCEAYARAFKVLCDKAGIPCVLVDGQAKNSVNSTGEAHMWNYVQIGGEWLAVDVTWNDPKGGVSGAVSGVENTKWLFAYENSEIGGMTFIESHTVANQVSVNGVGFINGPELAVFSPNATETREVATEAEFYEALNDASVGTIQLTGEITLSRSADGKDNAFVIGRPVTIIGGTLRLERAGIVLGADVVFENMALAFNSSVRNAIVANGYSLTLNNISNAGTYNVDLFCGGITDYNGGNAGEIPQTGTNGSITIQGSNNFNGGASGGIAGGNIYAGSLSDVGYTDENGQVLENIPNTFTGTATITMEAGAIGYGNIYGHGAREDRSGGHANEWNSGADLYKVSGQVSIYVGNNRTVAIDGATGGSKNAAFIYQDNGKGYTFTPTLENVDDVALLPSDNGVMAQLQPSTTQTCFDMLSVPENTRFSLVNMGNEIIVSSLEGGGELVLAEEAEYPEESQKLILTTATGTTKVAVGGVDGTGEESTGIIGEGRTCITVTDGTSEGEFVLMPHLTSPNMLLEKDADGNWTTVLGESSICLESIFVEKTFKEAEGVEEIFVPITVTYATEDEYNFLGDIPMVITVNGQETLTYKGIWGYDYYTGTTSSDIAMWCDWDNDTGEKEGLHIINYLVYDGGTNDPVPAGNYHISITIPANYMASGKAETISFVLTVGEEQKDNCDSKNHIDSNYDNVCDNCNNQLYLIGITSKCLGNGQGVAHISIKPSNQLASAEDKVTVTATNMLRYTFKGWYLLSDMNASNQIEDGKKALSTSLVYTFTPDKDVKLVAVYEAQEKEATITFDENTNVTVAVDGKNVNLTQDENGYIVKALIGSQVTVTVTEEGFINWCNKNGKIVTTKETYTFTLTGDATLKMSREGKSKESAMVEFISDYNQVIASRIYASDEAITFPDGPSKMGYTFKEWNLSQEEIWAKIKAGETHIKVTPIYIQDETKYTITVYVDGVISENLAVKDIPAGESRVVSAPQVDGKVFLYWTDEEGNILGYDTSYFMQVNKDIVVKAVYGIEVVEKKPVIAITNVYTTMEGEKKKISFSATRDIPDEYTLVEHGILYRAWTANEAPSEEDIVLGGSELRKSVSSATMLSGVFTMNLNVTGKEDVKVAARGYMIVKNAMGGEEIYYTDLSYCSYNEISQKTK